MSIDCVADLDLVEEATMRSAAADDDTDEAPAFMVTVPRPDPLAIDAPARDHFPTARYDDGDMRVRWSGGDVEAGVEILIQAWAADDTGQGVVRCWTSDDGTHDVPAQFVDPYREGTSVVTVSRIVSQAEEIGGWEIRSFWTESRSVSVFPY